MTPEQHPAFEHLEREIPEEWAEFSRLHQEFSEPVSKRANTILNSLVQKNDGEALAARTIRKNIAVFGARIRALIPQLDDNPEWEGRGATDERFRRCARTVRKSLQEVLTAPEFRVASTRQQAESADIEDLIVDPQQLTSTMLENLGIKPPKGRMAREVRMERMAESIPEIKQMVAQLKPLKLREDEQLSTEKKRRPGRGPIGSGLRLFVDPDGHVIGMQSRNGSGQKLMYRTDAHGAYRRIDHIREGYDKEIETLEKMKHTIADVSAQLGNWNDAKTRLNEIRGQLMGCVNELRHVSNDHKVELRKIIEWATSLQIDHTVRGKKQRRFNPGAIRARFTKIGKLVDARKTEIASIRTYLEEDQVVVKSHIARMRAPIQDFCATVDRLHERFVVLHEEELTDDQKRKIEANLRKLLRDCQSPGRLPQLQPYGTFVETMAEHIEKVLAHLEADDIPEAQKEFMNTYVVSKIEGLYTDLQDYYDQYLSSPEIPDFQLLYDKLIPISHRIIGRKVAPEVDTTEYNRFWGLLHRHFSNGLFKEINKALATEDPGHRRLYYQRMRERYKNVSFEEIR